MTAMPPIHRTRETAALVQSLLGEGPHPVSAVLACGVTRAQVRAALAAGTLVRFRHGVIGLPVHGGTGTEQDLLDDIERHVHEAAAILAAMDVEAFVARESAGLLLHQPAMRPGPRVPPLVHITSPRHGRILRGAHLRVADVPDEDRTMAYGLPLTSLARTALDLARFRPLPESLVVLDAALRQVPRRELYETLDRTPFVYGRAGLRRAIELADRRSESPLESASRGHFLDADLPAPELQAWVTDEDGLRHRLDFLWRKHLVIGEADGWGKLRDGNALRAEKTREDSLRRMGFLFVRWTSDELWRTPARVLKRLTDALRERQ